MFRYKKANDILAEERNRRIKAQILAEKCAADIDFLSMMTDIDLEVAKEENEQA